MTKYNVGDRIEFDLQLGHGIESGTILDMKGAIDDIEVLRDADGGGWTIDKSDIVSKLAQDDETMVSIDDIIILGDRDEVNKKLLFDNARLLEDNDAMLAEIVHLKDRVRKLLHESTKNSSLETILTAENDKLRKDLSNSCSQRLESRITELLTANDVLEDEKGELQEERDELYDKSMQQMEERSVLVVEYRELEQENKTLMKVIREIAGK